MGNKHTKVQPVPTEKPKIVQPRPPPEVPTIDEKIARLPMKQELDVYVYRLLKERWLKEWQAFEEILLELYLNDRGIIHFETRIEIQGRTHCCTHLNYDLQDDYGNKRGTWVITREQSLKNVEKVISELEKSDEPYYILRYETKHRFYDPYGGLPRISCGHMSHQSKEEMIAFYKKLLPLPEGEPGSTSA